MKTLYSRLGLDPSCEPDAIRRAFRAIAKESHPDRNPSKASLDRFLSAKEAYETLSDPTRRATYDAELARVCRSCGAETSLPGGETCLRCLVLREASSFAREAGRRRAAAEPPPIDPRLDREVIGRKKRPASTSRRPLREPVTRTVDVDVADVLPESTIDDLGTNSRGMSADSLLEALLAESAIRSNLEKPKRSKRSEKSKKQKTILEFEYGDATIRVKADPESLVNLDKGLEGASWMMGLLKRFF